MLRSTIAAAGLTVPTMLQLQAHASASPPRAKRCIVIYCWGGISHLESWDPKPEALSDLRGDFSAIQTATPGIQYCEHIPLMAQHSDKLAIVRSVYHRHGGHQQGMYTSITGHDPPGGVKAKNRDNWPSLAAMISRFQDPHSGTPNAIRIPYNMYDNGTLMAGEYGGWLGSEYDPVLMKTPAGKSFQGVSRYTNRELDLTLQLDKTRILQRQRLQVQLERQIGSDTDYDRLDRFRKMAADMLLGSAVREAYDLESEDPRIRALYGDHIGGQSMLLARRLTEAGVPVVQVCAGAGDLAGGGGDNWDTHRGHFSKMKDRLLPVFDRSVSALLTDLEQRGLLEETLVVALTDFGRTPKINNNGGRDHYPAVYSMALAGGGVRGGQTYGSSDSNGAHPKRDACTPADFHATVLTAMGINIHTQLHDELDRPYEICSGQPLPLF
ncbi:MAG: DUF1501 domain-containing protein [Planctomycetota bacterium]|nr:DUF1501 domain-containing protein [Planctomycetota bacterium]